jgi:hypothetical protein
VTLPSSMPGKIAITVAGTTGTGLGAALFAVCRITSARDVPAGLWAALVALIMSTALISALGPILDYLARKLEIETRSKQAASAAELQKTRLEMYRTVLEKSADEPDNVTTYRELITADAVHLSVEQSGVRLADHSQLQAPQSREPLSLAVRPDRCILRGYENGLFRGMSQNRGLRALLTISSSGRSAGD